MNMPKTQTVNNKAIVLSAVCLSLLCASTHTFAKTTDVTLPSYLIQRTYTTEEALELKKFDLWARREWARQKSILDSIDASKTRGLFPTDPKMEALSRQGAEKFLTYYKVQLKNECWNTYLFSKTKGAYSDVCYVLKMHYANSNTIDDPAKLTISEQRSLAEIRKAAERNTNFEIARDRRIEQETDSKDTEYAKHPY
jgi:hypothetical protein